MLSDACYLGCLLTCLILFGINDFELYKLDMCQDYELWMFLNFSNNQIRIPTTSVKKLSKILKWVDDNTTLRQRLVCKKFWPLADLLANSFWPKYFGWCLVPKLVCDRVGGGWVILSAWVGRLQYFFAYTVPGRKFLGQAEIVRHLNAAWWWRDLIPTTMAASRFIPFPLSSTSTSTRPYKITVAIYF